MKTSEKINLIRWGRGDLPKKMFFVRTLSLNIISSRLPKLGHSFNPIANPRVHQPPLYLD